MTINFVPGEVNKSVQSVVQTKWKNHTILSYCSGNNLIILSNDITHLQTIYLERDSQAIAIDENTGRIALAISRKVIIFKPVNEFMRIPRWTVDIEIHNDKDASNINCLDWSGTNELVVGTDRALALWHIYDDYGDTVAVLRWYMIQANPVHIVKITKSSCKISSVGKYDRFVKIWNRVSFTDNSIYDLVYLNHPSYVTSLRWRIGEDEDCPETLYTLASDSVMRIWSSYEFDGSHNVQHWGSLSLFEDSVNNSLSNRYINIIDNKILQASFKNSLSKLDESEKRNQELLNIFQSKVELALISDEMGNVSIYTLANVSLYPPKLIKINKIMVQKFNPSTFPSCPKILTFAEPVTDQNHDISIIIHDIAKGSMKHSVFNFEPLLRQNSFKDCDFLLQNRLKHKFTGHNKSIQNLVRTYDGTAMISCSRFEENYIWNPLLLQGGVTLTKKSRLVTPAPILKCILLNDCEFAVTLVRDKIILWDYSKYNADAVAEFDNYGLGLPISFLTLPEFGKTLFHIVAIYNKKKAKAWKVNIITKTIEAFEIENLPQSQDIYKISVVDPVGWNLSLTETDRNVVSVIDSKGLLTMYSCEIMENKIKWVKSCEFDTFVSNAKYIRANSLQKISIVGSDAKTLSIWNTKRCVLEYEEFFDNKDDQIRDLDWTCAPNNRSILAVGFNHYVSLYTQLRYDYTNETPSFTSIKKIDISDHTTHPIGDSVWLNDGTLVIATGNQFYVSDKQLDLTTDEATIKSLGSRKITNRKEDIFELAGLLNGPLPFYHPQFLIQFLFWNKVELVKTILVNLFNFLRNLDLDPTASMDDLDANLGVGLDEVLKPAESSQALNKYKKPNTYFSQNNNEHDELFRVFDKELCDLLSLKLQNTSLPFLTRHQQMTLVNLINIIHQIEKYCSSLDENGIRFFIGLKLLISNPNRKQLTMRDVNWALHCENKEILVNIVNESVYNQMSWFNAKKFGLAYWLTQELLVESFEKIAQNEFNKDDEKDPKNCAIFYIALKKKRILINLWKVAIGNPEQSKMIAFLKNDFKQKRWKSAALKNAFVLLGKHRYMDAAVFFLLGDGLKDCVNVLIKQVKDIQLAIAVARIYEGENGSIFKFILESQIIPQTIASGDRWTSSWIYWTLNDDKKAIQSLIQKPIEVCEAIGTKEINVDKSSLNFLEDDPVLIILFNNLKLKRLEYLQGSLLITPEMEFNFILRISQIYNRMGCDYISLYLVKNYKFLSSEKIVRSNVDTIDNNSSPMKIQPPPLAVFEEPDMSAFDFGF